MKTTSMTTAAVILGALILSGCAGTPELGRSVRSTMMNQVYDVTAAIYPSEEPVTGADPYQLENVVNAHRAASAPSEPQGPGITLNIGSGNRR